MDSYGFLIAYLICSVIILFGLILMEIALKKNPHAEHTPLASTVVGIGLFGIFISFLGQLKMSIMSSPAINHFMREESPILAICIMLSAALIYVGTLEDAIMYGSPDNSEFDKLNFIYVIGLGVLCLGFTALIYA